MPRQLDPLYSVTITLKDKNQIESKFLIIAEGTTGNLHKQVGYSGNREWTMALEFDVFPKTFPKVFYNITVFDFGFFKKGYGWIFPKDDRINMGAWFYHSPQIHLSQIKALIYTILSLPRRLCVSNASMFSMLYNGKQTRVYPMVER